MERPVWMQGVGFALMLLTARAVVEQRKPDRDSSEQTPPSVVARGSASAQVPAPAPHLGGTSLLSAFYQKDIDSISPGARRETLRIFILTLPDPVSSHLDWSYDAELESMRRAMEHSGYVIDRFWLPWRTTADTTAGRLGVADSLPGARWPGVMLFRRGNTSEDALVLVYVVGEVPTSGIHRLAMKEALEERRRLLPIDSVSPTTDTVRVIGPAFSGSALSLRRALAGWRATVKDNPVIEIVSGSASDATNLQTLSDTTLRMRFRATVHTSGGLAAAALALVTRQLHIPASEVAFLHEGTTQFGNSARRDSSMGPDSSTRRDSVAGRDSALGRAAAASTRKKDTASTPPPDTARTLPLEIAFPMSISGLRAQYARHPERLVQPAPGSSAPEGPRLALDQREPASLSESPGFLSQLTSPSSELLLAQIQRSLLAHHIRAVGILATDVRDELFLADEIRKRVPDVQLFFYGSNVLLLRPEYQKALRGSLVISTYPLVMENQFWDLTRNSRERLIFMGDEAQGVFNATLYQLGRGAEMMEYASPMAKGISYGPPIWLTVIGRDAMYPVALADNATTAHTKTESRYLASRVALPVRPASEVNVHGRQFVLALFLMLAGFVTSFVLLQRRTSRRVNAVAAFSTDIPGQAQEAGVQLLEEPQPTVRKVSLLLHREMYVLLRQFSLFAGFSCAVLLLLRPQAHGVPTARSVLWILALVALLLTLVVFWRALVQSHAVLAIGRQHGLSRPSEGASARKRDRLLSGVERGARFLVFLLGLLYFEITLIFLWDIISLDPATSALFFQRAVAVTSGVSPAAPLILVAVGFAAWCTWHLTRIALLAEPTVYGEFLQRQADSEAIRRTAIQAVRSLEQEASARARGAHEWTRYAIRTYHRRLPEAARWSALSPLEALERAEKEAAEAEKCWHEAQEEVRRAINATPSAGWPSQNTLTEESQEVERSATKAKRYVTRARGVLDGVHPEPSLQPPIVAAEMTWLQRSLHDLRIDVAALSRAEESIADALVRSARHFPLLSRVRHAARGASAFVDWFERGSHDFRTTRRTPSAARELSDALFYLIPNGVALTILIVAIGFAVFLALQFELSLESLVIAPLPRFGDATSFDVLFRFGVLTLTGLTAWAVYRLAVVWTAIRRILDEFQPDLVPSFVNLPPKLARVTHLTLFGHASAAEIEEVVNEQLGKMKRAYASADQYLTGDIRTDLGSEPRLMAPIPRARPYRLEVTAYTDLARLHDTLEICRKHHLLGPDVKPQATAGTAEQVTWARSVANLYVVFVADYVDWVFQHLRYLASFLLVCLLVVVVLLSAYPFQPQSALRVIHTIILVVAVATLVLVIVQMNRQPVLSAIANTTPDAVNWNSHFVSTLATYGALPLLTLLSTEFPAVRDFLFSWVAPLIRAFAKG